MKKNFNKIVAWQFDGRTAVGVLNEDYTNNYVSVAVNYFMDSNMQEGWLWYADDIFTDEGTTIRPATDEEIQTLIKALDEHNVKYEYDAETKTIFDKGFYEVNNK
jgi:hypothetical protein